jgi:hypothetical protein
LGNSCPQARKNGQNDPGHGGILAASNLSATLLSANIGVAPNVRQRDGRPDLCRGCKIDSWQTWHWSMECACSPPKIWVRSEMPS